MKCDFPFSQRVDYSHNVELVGQPDLQHIQIIEEPIAQHPFIQEPIAENSPDTINNLESRFSEHTEEESGRKGLNKDLMIKNGFLRCVRTGPLHSDLMQVIVNHYTSFRNDKPMCSHGKAISETARALGVSVRMVMVSLKELKVPRSAKEVNDAGEGVLVEEVTSSKECLRLVDERIVIGLAKAFRCQIVIKDRKKQLYRIYKPSTAKKKTITMSFNGCSYKKVANCNELFSLRNRSRNLTCPSCQKEFKREQALISHLRIHKSRTCGICGKQIEAEENISAAVLLARHEADDHKEETALKRKKPVKCKKCHKIFTTRASLMRHRTICSPSCDYCRKTFRSRAGLNNHPCPFNIKIPNLNIDSEPPEVIQLLREGQDPVILKKAEEKKAELKSSRFYSDKIAALKVNTLI